MEENRQGEGPETLFARYLERLEAGDDVDLVEMIREHPRHAAALRTLASELRAWERVDHEDAFGPPVPSEATRPNDLGDPARWRSAALRRLVTELDARRTGGVPHRTGERFDEGGMGELRQGWDPVLHRSVAVKRILPRHQSGPAGEDLESLVTRFLTEAQITAQLDHPGVIPIHDVGIDEEGQLYITMPKVAGVTLSEVFEHTSTGEGGWTLARALGVLVRVAETIAHAHARGIVHRDLKPANVMVGAHGEVYVMDWGLAAETGAAPREELVTLRNDAADATGAPARTAAGDVVGTPAYMAPEQAAGERASAAWDVYALGALLYELLAGARPYAEARGAEAILAALRAEPPSPLDRVRPRPQAELVSITERAMSRDPRTRYAGADAFAADLRAYLEGRVVGAHEQGAVPELRKWVRRNPAVATAGILAVAATVFALLARGEALAAESEGFSRLASRQALETARQQLSRGRFEAALENLATAERSGFEDPVELELMGIDALGGLERSAEERERLEALADRIESGEIEVTAAQRGALLVRLGTGVWARGPEEAAERQAFLEAALELPLSDADQSVALAYLAPRTSDSLTHLAAAVDRDPFRRQVFSEYVQLLMFCGRFEEMETESRLFEQLYPDDPMPPLARGLAALVLQEEARMSAELAALEGRMPEDSRASVEAMYDGIYELVAVFEPDVLHGKLPLLGISRAALRLAKINASASGLSEQPDMLSVPGIPGVRQLFSTFRGVLAVADFGARDANLAGVLGVIRDLKQSEGLLQNAAEASEYHDDGTLKIIALLGEGRLPTGEGEVFTPDPRQLALDLEEAVSRPTVFPMFRRLGRFRALEARCRALEEGIADDWRDSFAERFAWFLERDDLGEERELPKLVELARRVELWDVVVALSERSLAGRRPPTAPVLRARFDALLATARYSEAGEAIGRLGELPEKDRPTDDELAELRAEWRGRAAAWAEEVGLGPQ